MCIRDRDTSFAGIVKVNVAADAVLVSAAVTVTGLPSASVTVGRVVPS